MDVKVKKLYYYLKGLDGKYKIFLREEVIGPYISLKQLDVNFDDEDEVKDYVKELNDGAENDR